MAHVVQTVGYCSPRWLSSQLVCCVLIRCDCHSVSRRKYSQRVRYLLIWEKNSNTMDATIATIAREPLTYTANGTVRPASLNRETYASLMGVKQIFKYTSLTGVICNILLSHRWSKGRTTHGSNLMFVLLGGFQLRFMEVVMVVTCCWDDFLMFDFRETGRCTEAELCCHAHPPPHIAILERFYENNWRPPASSHQASLLKPLTVPHPHLKSFSP